MPLMFLGEKNFGEAPCGRKAASLHELMIAGFAVPPGFSVPVESPPDPDTIFAAVEKMGGYPVAVRSSGSAEDLEGASFAGQYKSFMDVKTPEDLMTKIKLCRDSGQSPEVQAYLSLHASPGSTKNIFTTDAEIPVLVQRMVNAQTAGVAFTLDPVTGMEEHGLIEACHGLGEKLVSGHVSPSRFRVSLEEGKTGKCLDREPGDQGVVLSEEALMELSERLLEIQAHFGIPQDVEWAIDPAGKLWILQSRPITRIQWRTDVEELTNADFKDGGVSARVCPPFLYALYRDAVQPSMQRYFVELGLMSKRRKPETWISIYYGRPYWNASAVKRALGKIPGFNEAKFDQDLGIQKNYGSKGPRIVPTNPGTVLRAIPVAFGLERCYRNQLKLVEGYEKIFLSAEKRRLAEIDRFGLTPGPDFIRSFETLLDFHQRTEMDYFFTIYNNTNLQSDLKSLIGKIDRATGGQTALLDLIAGLAAGSGCEIAHLGIQRGLLALLEVARGHGLQGAEWKIARSEFLEKHYYHADAELDILCPRWGEVPERMDAIIAGMLTSGTEPSDPAKTVDLQKLRFENEMNSVRSRIQSTFVNRLRFAASFEKTMARARVYLSRREEMRDYSSRCYHLVRQFALEAGARLKKAGILIPQDGIFMLEPRETVELLAGKLTVPRARELIRHRELMYRGHRKLTPPNELGRDVLQPVKESPGDSSGVVTMLQGLGCSAGRIEGIVRVIHRIEDTALLKKGEILVTRFTDPGWTPALGLVSGVITEVGGVLSHAAVIGREFGIPAVLNLPAATRLLKDGQRVRVDGTAGTVEIL